MLSGHIDTVKANEKLYNTNPYMLTEKDGKMFGLGSIDMKSFTAIILDNIDKLVSIEEPLILVLTTDEETELKSIEVAIKILKEFNILPKFTIVGEPTQSKFKVTSNACYEYCARFFGKACHSSKINEGINAICASAKLINFIENQQKKYRLTSNCGVITGGEVINKVADYTELEFDIRSIYANDVAKFIGEIKAFLEDLTIQYDGLKTELINSLAIPALNCKDNSIIQSIAKEMQITIGDFSGGCEAGYYTQLSGDAIIFGVGDLSLAHKANEFVDVKEYYEYTNKLLILLDKIIKYYY